MLLKKIELDEKEIFSLVENFLCNFKYFLKRLNDGDGKKQFLIQKYTREFGKISPKLVFLIKSKQLESSILKDKYKHSESFLMYLLFCPENWLKYLELKQFYKVKFTYECFDKAFFDGIKKLDMFLKKTFNDIQEKKVNVFRNKTNIIFKKLKRLTIKKEIRRMNEKRSSLYKFTDTK